jgi:hypothetical protein
MAGISGQLSLSKVEDLLVKEISAKTKSLNLLPVVERLQLFDVHIMAAHKVSEYMPNKDA